MAQVYVPQMGYPVQQQESFIDRNKIIIGVLVVLVVLYLMNKDVVDAYVSNALKSSTAVGTPQGGVTTQGSPTTQPAVPGTSVSVAGTPTTVVPQVKVIEVTKDSSDRSAMPAGENEGWRTFQIGEVKVYGANGLLSAADFESATYTASDGVYSGIFPASNDIDGNPGSFTHTSGGAAVHQLTLKLKNAQLVTKVEVLNRADCCQSRLAGAVIRLKDSSGAVLKQQVLTADRTQVMSV